MRILRNSKKLAVDANPILSAIIGGSARKVFIGDETISFYTTEFNFKEIEKYIPVFSAKKSHSSGRPLSRTFHHSNYCS